MFAELSHHTNRRECFSDITVLIENLVEKSGVENGLCVVYVPHTTAGVTINERADPDVVRDILGHLGKLIPRDADFKHYEGNSDAHIKTSLIGSSVTVFIKDGRLLLGTWQAIFFAEFDGPRHRTIQVQIIPATNDYVSEE